MASVNVGEADFDAVASAAWEAKAAGREDEAKALDKLARKINAALATATAGKATSLRNPTPLSWTDVPSVFDVIQENER